MRAVVLQDAARLGEPVAGEIVIGGKAVELVPIVVDRIDPAAFGPEQVAAELQIVGRVGEDHVDATCRAGAPSRRCNRPGGSGRAAARASRGTGARAQAPRLSAMRAMTFMRRCPLLRRQGESGRTRGQANRG